MSDFMVTYDINEDGQPVTFSLTALDTKEFDEPVANHIKDHLAKKIAFQKRGNGSFEDAYNDAVRDIEGRT